MSNARNLANLLGTATTIQTSKIADDAITGGKLANDIAISTTGNIATTGSGTLTVAGNTTLSGTNNLGSNPTVTLGNNTTFPAKSPVSIYYGGLNTNSLTLSAGTAYANNDSISLTPKSSTSQFLVVMSGKCARNSTASAMYFSFTFGKNSLSTNAVELAYVTDDPRHNSNTVLLYASPGTQSLTWTTSDTLYFGTWVRSDGTIGYLEDYSLTVFEYMAN